MSVYRPKYRDEKTGKLTFSPQWWYDFMYDGQRYRQSAKTTRKTIATQAEDDRRRELQESRATGKPKINRQKRILTVQTALAAYKKAYPINHREKGAQMVVERSAPLERHLGGLVNADLSEERMTTYMIDRRAEGAGNRTINMELAVLSRALGSKFQMLWPTLKRLEERRDVGRALSAEEEQRIVDAASRNNSRMIGPIVRIALVTGMRRDEIRLLKWSQIDFEAKRITVGKSKSAAGQGRVIPLRGMLDAVITAYMGWYVSKLGAIKPDGYVFPFSNRRRPIDVDRPVTSIKTAWGSVCKTAGVKCRFHDLRHTVCTKMAEAGVPESTMKAIMGHMSPGMLERYSHIRHAAKVDAIEAVESRSAFFNGMISPKVSDSASPIATVTH